MASTTPATPTLPDGIEIFRAGRHTDDSGVVHTFGPAELRSMAASYSPELREAPLTIGHPKDNLPAYGWVKSVAQNANTLVITPHQVEPQFAQMVSAGRFKKRSASFYTPHSPHNPTPGHWYLRHVAFLGAQPPAIAGLKDIAFSQDDAGAVCFSEALSADPADPAPTLIPTPTPTPPTTQDPTDMSKELQAQLDEANAKLQAANAATAKAQTEAATATQKAATAEATAASFAEQARADRKAGFVSFAQAQVQAGKLLPKDEAMAVATLQALADAQPVEFAEGDATRKVSPAQWLQDHLASAAPAVSFGEFAPGKGTGQIQPGSARGKSDAEIDTAARSFMRTHKVDYAEALGAVTSSFTS